MLLQLDCMEIQGDAKQDPKQCSTLVKSDVSPSSPAGMVGFFLNAISIVSFLTVKEMRNPSNFFVFNLAVADLCLNINGLTAAYASYVRYESVVLCLCVFNITAESFKHSLERNQKQSHSLTTQPMANC